MYHGRRSAKDGRHNGQPSALRARLAGDLRATGSSAAVAAQAVPTRIEASRRLLARWARGVASANGQPGAAGARLATEWPALLADKKR